MTKHEINPKIEARKAARKKIRPFRRIRASFFIRHSSFVLRHFLILFLAACTKHAPAPPPPPGPQQLVVPEHGAYTGAYIDFGDNEDSVTIEAIEDFEKLVGKHQAIVASSSYWGEQTFPTDNVNLIHRHGSIPMIYWSPWDRPYVENEEDDPRPAYAQADKFSLTNIIAGKWDDYIDKWADSARAFGQPMFVSLCNEMNGTWFPWSGIFYGADKEVPGQPDKYMGPETFKKAWRHVVDRVRARGANNILWVFHVMNYSIPQDNWNYAAQYYPGADYVDWFGLSVYGMQFRYEHWSDFSGSIVNGKFTGGLLDWPYDELCKIDPAKPIMLAEWGVGEFPDFGSKPKFISQGFAEMEKRPRIKAAIYWHERWQNEELHYSNLHVNSTPESLEAYRSGVGNPFWLSAPVYKPR
jgi:hypothetical protein